MQLNRFVVDLVGMPSVGNPTGPHAEKLTRLLKQNMQQSGLHCSVFMPPPTSEQVNVPLKGPMLMHHTIVASDVLPRLGRTEYSVTGICCKPAAAGSSKARPGGGGKQKEKEKEKQKQAAEPNSFDVAASRKPQATRAIIGVYSVAKRYADGGMPTLDDLDTVR
jgi:hypothetical protein